MSSDLFGIERHHGYTLAFWTDDPLAGSSFSRQSSFYKRAGPSPLLSADEAKVRVLLLASYTPSWPILAAGRVDYCLATPAAVIRFPELTAEAAELAKVSAYARIPASVVRRGMLLDESMSAARALELSLVDEIVERTALFERGRELGRLLADAGGP